MTFSQDEQWLVTHGSWTEIFIWEIKSGKLVRTIKGPMDFPGITAISPDRKWIASSYNSSVLVWNTDTGDLIYTLYHGNDPSISFSGMAFSPDSRVLVSSVNEKLFIWDIISGKLIRSFGYVKGIGGNCEFLQDGKRVFFAQDGGSIVDIEKGINLLKLSANEHYAILSSDYKRIFNLGDTGSGSSFNEYSIETGELLHQTIFNSFFNIFWIFRNDGQYLLTLDQIDSSLVMRISSVTSKDTVKTSNAIDIPKDVNTESSIAIFSPKGNYAAVTMGRYVYLYDISDLSSSVSNSAILNN